ncbi:gamma-glutamylcyclotransferase [Larsenimonas suaedae]|uniref:glutathione-specific gamma-glutamylcyclotransferase n=1 Tax=Larsenimonas suaedae TaxID=1851019 RepID=A0ABU1GWP1_9GAMM|nr:gamma-glutamylcyclotransferase [Larsenimonas suaedae]MCM2973352.1 gamma-glutamylcyclotransferase [Larsenimonas suaedae]MDR5896245.1 gamma-glutamylcyclotransferase [Larsenimonas suaedae]
MAHDTTEINRQNSAFDGDKPVWLFGYGSLIFKAGFEYLQRRPAWISGYERRFWQGSHDHRGTPEAPGRVATLIESPEATCWGMGYLVTPEVFDSLDVREKNGYLRRTISMTFDTNEMTDSIVYWAGPDNAAWLGEASEAEIAAHIAVSEGPSGPNREYLLKLADSLRELNDEDPHVFEIERHLRALIGESAFVSA